jgi:hypothetical protein
MTEEYGHIPDAFDMLPDEDILTEHPANNWEWEDTAEVAFQEWFNDDYGSPYSLRSEWFFGDCKVQDENTLKDLMYKWLHSAFLTGYNTGRCAKTND